MRRMENQMFQILFEHPLVCVGLVAAGALCSESLRRLANKATGGRFFGKQPAKS
jgi:hypothetical protein